MEASVAADWASHTLAALDGAGYRSSGPRTAVVEAVAELGCSVTAREIDELLQAQGQRVGLASIYRTLELLERLRLVQRVEGPDGAARWEPSHPSGEHHHHLICDSCGDVTAFEDPALERAIERLSRRVDFAIGAHDVTLRGECPACRAAAAQLSMAE